MEYRRWPYEIAEKHLSTVCEYRFIWATYVVSLPQYYPHSEQTKEKPQTTSSIAHMTNLEVEMCWYCVQRKRIFRR
jgi:hypothetical protein